MKKIILAGLAVVTVLLMASMANAVPALTVKASSSVQNGAVSLTFDDGTAGQYEYAWPIMQSRGVVGTFYVISNYVNAPAGSSFTPCGFMTNEQINDLFLHGNEIGSHGVTHNSMSGMSLSDVRAELTNSKAALEGIIPGLTVKNFAYPYGGRSDATDQIARDYYRSVRDDIGESTPLPCTLFLVPAWATDNLPSNTAQLNAYEAAVDRAFDKQEWIILFFHEILPANQMTSNYDTSTATFSSIIDYIQNKGMPILTVNQALDLGSSPTPSPPEQPPTPSQPGKQIAISSVVASSYSDGSDGCGSHPPDLAIDGIENPSNYWGTNALVSAGRVPQWLRIDFGSIHDINTVTTHFYDGGTRTYTYYIEASVDDASWTTIVSTKTGSGIATDTFTDTNARYVRITITGNTANAAAHIEEIRVYGSDSPPDSPTQPPSSKITLNITLNPLGLTVQYILDSGTAWTAPNEITQDGRTYTFVKWSDGTTDPTRVFTSDGDYEAIYA